MALGKQIGEFSYKIVSTTYTPGPGGVPTMQLNFEGSVSGDVTGPAEGTLSVAGAGGQSGTWSWCGGTYPADGNAVYGGAQGTWETIGTYTWRLRGTGQLSDGRTVAIEAEGAMATRTLAGTLYEWS